MPPHTLLITALALPPTTAFFLTAYLRNNPLHSSYSSKIIEKKALILSLTNSNSLKTTNPRNHVSMSDTWSLVLPSKEVGNLSDEEVLARFMHGFFNGWVFTPEQTLLSFLGLLGRKLVPVGFTGVSMDGPVMTSPGELDRTKLPEKGTVLFGGNFFVLDVHLKQQDEMEGSFVDVAFGDNRKRFSGLHRFEVTRDVSEDGKEEGDVGAVRVEYSSISCNPSENKRVFPNWVWVFHKWYAMVLFRDGIREVLAQ
jgi:hypothetical protein